MKKFTEPCIEIIKLEISDIMLASNEWIGWFGDIDTAQGDITRIDE